MDPLQATATAGNGIVLSGDAVQEFAGRLRGPLITPDDENYDAARQVWNGMIDKRPALIARCSGTADGELVHASETEHPADAVNTPPGVVTYTCNPEPEQTEVPR